MSPIPCPVSCCFTGVRGEAPLQRPHRQLLLGDPDPSSSSSSSDSAYNLVIFSVVEDQASVVLNSVYRGWAKGEASVMLLYRV